MGRGSKTRESSVVKERPAYSSDGTGAGKTSRSQDETSCLFSINGIIKLTEQKVQLLAESAPIVILPDASNPDNLEWYINGKSFGRYTGSSSKKIASCIKAGYIYEGAVKKIVKTEDGFSVSFQIQGYGRLK